MVIHSKQHAIFVCPRMKTRLKRYPPINLSHNRYQTACHAAGLRKYNVYNKTPLYLWILGNKTEQTITAKEHRMSAHRLDSLCEESMRKSRDVGLIRRNNVSNYGANDYRI